MKIVKAGYEQIKETDILKKIELIARVCYKSEDKIGPGTDVEMIEKLLANNHLAMLEHSSLCYQVSENIYNDIVKFIGETMHNISWTVPAHAPNIPKIYYTSCYDEIEDALSCVVSGNLRAWIDLFKWYTLSDTVSNAISILKEHVFEDTRGLIDCRNQTDRTISSSGYTVTRIMDFSVLQPIERMVHETFSVKFTCDRGVTHELVRMRECSFAQESTRYCNYNLGKYDGEVSMIEPIFWNEEACKDSILGASVCRHLWEAACDFAGIIYKQLIKNKAVAQQARDVLPTSVKADIVLTTNLVEWRHIFELRACDATGPAHPQMKEVMVPLFLEKREELPFAFGDLKLKEELA